MAHPDLDHGYLKLAHELFAALTCAGFSKWEWIVLREVFDQIYGPKKPKTAKLSPTRIAARIGTYKESITRATRTLIQSGVLARTAEGDVKFLKNYETWKDGERHRFSTGELAYCHAARRIKASNTMGNNGAPIQSRFPFPDGNTGAPGREHGRSRPGTRALPAGNTGAPVGAESTSKERARIELEEFKEVEEGVREDAPRQTVPFARSHLADPEVERIAEIALSRWPTEFADCYFSDLCREYPIPWVARVLDMAWDRSGGRELPRPWIRRVLQSWHVQGGPPKDRELPANRRASGASPRTPEQRQAVMDRIKAKRGE